MTEQTEQHADLEPDEDDLAFARDTLGPDASEEDVRDLADRRVAVRAEERDLDAAREEALVDDEDDGLNAYDIEVTDVDVQFLTNVPAGPDATTLGDAADVAAINLIRVGLDGYRMLYTDRPTGRQWIGEGGIFVAVPSSEEGADGGTD